MGQFIDWRTKTSWVIGERYPSDPFRNALLALYIDSSNYCAGNIRYYEGYDELEEIW